MPRSGFRRRGARMRHAAEAAAGGGDAAAAGGGANAGALPPPPFGMPFSRRGRRRRQAPGDTGSVLPKLLMKFVIYGVVIVVMKYGKKEGGAGDSDIASGSPTSRIVSKISSLLDDVLGKSGDQALLPGTKTLRVGTGDDGAANVYVVPNFLLNDVATRWRHGALYEFKRSGGIPDSHPLNSEVIKTLASSDVQRKFHALGIDNVEGDTAHIVPYSSILGYSTKNDNGWKLIIPLSDADTSRNPTIQFACTASHADKETDQNWCGNVQLLHNTAVILEGAAKFEIQSSSGDDTSNHYVGVLGTFQTKAKEEL